MVYFHINNSAPNAFGLRRRIGSDILLLDYVDYTTGGKAQGGDDRQGHEGQSHEGIYASGNTQSEIGADTKHNKHFGVRFCLRSAFINNDSSNDPGNFMQWKIMDFGLLNLQLDYPCAGAS